MWHVLVVSCDCVGWVDVPDFERWRKKSSHDRASCATVGIRSNVVFVQLLPGATMHNKKLEDN